MKKIILLLIIQILLITNISATESNIKMQIEYGTDNNDLLSILRFENIGLDKVSFVGDDLKDKHFVITIKEFTNGKFAKQEIIDSKKLGDYGKIEGSTFNFRVLSRRTPENSAKFQFQFDRFINKKEFIVGADKKDFVMKYFFRTKAGMAIPVNEDTYIMTYMLPYIKPDGSGAYCEVAQSGTNPEELGVKYNIPTYFLIGIKFE